MHFVTFKTLVCKLLTQCVSVCLCVCVRLCVFYVRVCVLYIYRLSSIVSNIHFQFGPNIIWFLNGVDRLYIILHLVVELLLMLQLF